MQTSVVALLFVTSSVLLACVVINYAVEITEQTIDTQDSPQIDRIQELEKMLLDQTDTQPIEQILPYKQAGYLENIWHIS